MSLSVYSLFIVLFATVCFSQQLFNVEYYYAESATTCPAGGYIGFVARNGSQACSPSGCFCLTGFGCSVRECGAVTLPADPPSALVFADYGSPTDCTGSISIYTAATSGICLPSNLNFTTSGKFVCDGSFTSTSYGNGNCSGSPQSTIGPFPFTGSLCIPGGSSTSTYLSCAAAKCFHKDSKIKYHNQELTFEALSAPQNDLPCVIPHVFKSTGVKIHTTCEGVLRLTHEHLVMSNHGWRKAGNIQKGDLVYPRTHDKSSHCEVTKIEMEQDQEYFGLNCEDSHVLSDGYWVSTFGITHTIPATWMKLMSKLVGTRVASSIGDKIAQYFGRWAYLL